MSKAISITTRHWKSLLALNLVVVLCTVGAAVTSKKVWTATTQLILPKTTSNLDANLGTLGSLRNGDAGFSSEVNPLKVQASILTSDTLLEQVLNIDPEKSNFTDLTRYKSLFKVKPQEQSTIISLTVSASSQELAQKRSQNLIEAYQQRLNELREANSQTRYSFNQKELEQTKNKLIQAQIQLAHFKQSTGLVNSEEQTKGIVNTLQNLTTVTAQAKAEAEANENRARSLAQRLNLDASQAVRSLGLADNKEFQYLRDKLAEVETTLLKKQALFTNEHPEVQTLFVNRNQLQRQLQNYIAQISGSTGVDTTVATDKQGRATLIQQMIVAETEAKARREQAQQLEKQIAQLKANLKSIPANQARLQELQQQVDVAEGVYKGLVAQTQQNNIDAFDAYPNVQVLDLPRVDPKPVSPKFLLMAINALMASIIGSIALVLLLESRNPLLSPKDLQTQKFAIVENIPRFRESNTLTNETEVEFQRLASAISLQPIENRRLLITSASVGEGKTTVTLRLAYALVDLGFRVLLVDGDFRQAELSRRLGYVQESTTENPVITIQPNLDLLPTLPKQGKIVEMIRRGRFEQALSACETTSDYDYVLVDSAPVSLTSETALIATIVPYVLFVVRPDASYRNSVNESLAQLALHNAQILGLVVNGTESNSRNYSLRYQTPLPKGG